ALLNAMAGVIIAEGLAVESAAGFASLKSALAGATPEKAAAVCGVSAEEIVTLAKDYAAAEKALIILPIGLGYPGHTAQLAQACANLAILTGKVGKEGCGLLVMGEKNNSQGAADLGIHPKGNGLDAAGIIEACAAGTV